MARRRSKGHYSGIGGQAVIEGVMMKNKDRYAVAVRTPANEIEVVVDEYDTVAPHKALTRIPFIRGIFNFLDSLILGTKTLSYSASFYEEEDEKSKKGKASESEDAAEKNAEAEQGDVVEKPARSLNDNSGKALGVFSIILSIIIAVGLFMLLPYFLSRFLTRWIESETLLAVCEGVIRVLIFVGYIVSISLMKDIRRVYMYHGAEHKCINCLERGRALSVVNVRNSSRLHKRCGTSFLFYVVFISVILFIFIRVDNPILRVVVRILLVPVIASISYEIIRFAGKSNNIFLRILSAPGMLLQRLTTKEPTDDQIEVAIASVEAVFDWKQYLRKEFDVDPDAFAVANSQSEPVFEENPIEMAPIEMAPIEMAPIEAAPIEMETVEEQPVEE